MPGLPKGGTVYLAACDRELMAHQSNYRALQRHSHSWHWIALQNRRWFHLRGGSSESGRFRKRVFHTIIPGFLPKMVNLRAVWRHSADAAARTAPSGSQLGWLWDELQAALPRWRFVQGKTVLAAPHVAQTLTDRGHNVSMSAREDCWKRLSCDKTKYWWRLQNPVRMEWHSLGSAILCSMSLDNERKLLRLYFLIKTSF